ncbi:MAG TPA: ABC transporter ATP-binding protein, partial [Microbacterium sp.]|nr:ABC transporter ATP-binding protein [Microbacterium sp.]
MAARDASTPRPASVTARGWGWRHGGRRMPAVHDLDLDLRPGERVLLLGASGA